MMFTLYYSIFTVPSYISIALALFSDTGINDVYKVYFVIHNNYNSKSIHNKYM